MELLTLPHLGRVHAGFQSPALDYSERRVDLNQSLIKHPAATFLFDIEGDSMIGAFMPPDCTVMVDRTLTVNNGCIVLAAVDGEFTVKRYTVKGAAIILMPENPKYQSIPITEGTDFEIWGVVTYIITNAKFV